MLPVKDYAKKHGIRLDKVYQMIKDGELESEVRIVEEVKKKKRTFVKE